MDFSIERAGAVNVDDAGEADAEVRNLDIRVVLSGHVGLDGAVDVELDSLQDADAALGVKASEVHNLTAGRKLEPELLGVHLHDVGGGTSGSNKNGSNGESLHL